MKHLILILVLILSGVIGFVACDDKEKQVLLPIVSIEQCKATTTDDGYILKCGNAEPIVIKNGKDGQDGQDGEDANIEIIYLCGHDDGEILIRLPDNTLVAYHKGGCLNTTGYLTILTPGDYTSSDGHNCKFTVDENNNIIYK
jgi:hypothetical protein